MDANDTDNMVDSIIDTCSITITTNSTATDDVATSLIRFSSQIIPPIHLQKDVTATASPFQRTTHPHGNGISVSTDNSSANKATRQGRQRRRHNCTCSALINISSPLPSRRRASARAAQHHHRPFDKESRPPQEREIKVIEQKEQAPRRATRDDLLYEKIKNLLRVDKVTKSFLVEQLRLLQQPVTGKKDELATRLLACIESQTLTSDGGPPQQPLAFAFINNDSTRLDDAGSDDADDADDADGDNGDNHPL